MYVKFNLVLGEKLIKIKESISIKKFIIFFKQKKDIYLYS